MDILIAFPGDGIVDELPPGIRLQHSATLNGRDLGVSGYDESTGIALRDLNKHIVVVIDADCRPSNSDPPAVRSRGRGRERRRGFGSHVLR